MKFVEAALFRVAVSPSVRIRDGTRQDRADARFVIGKWLGKTTESDEHLFATDTGVYTTNTVKRVPDAEQRRADLVKSLQGTLWDRLAGRPAGRLRQTAPQAPPVATPPVAKETERPSEDAEERRIAKAQDLNPPAVPHVIAQQTPRTNRARHLDPWVPTMGGARGDTASDDRTQARSPAPAPSSLVEQIDQGGKRSA